MGSDCILFIAKVKIDVTWVPKYIASSLLMLVTDSVTRFGKKSLFWRKNNKSLVTFGGIVKKCGKFCTFFGKFNATWHFFIVANYLLWKNNLVALVCDWIPFCEIILRFAKWSPNMIVKWCYKMFSQWKMFILTLSSK